MMHEKLGMGARKMLRNERALVNELVDDDDGNDDGLVTKGTLVEFPLLHELGPGRCGEDVGSMFGTAEEPSVNRPPGKIFDETAGKSAVVRKNVAEETGRADGEDGDGNRANKLPVVEAGVSIEA